MSPSTAATFVCLLPKTIICSKSTIILGWIWSQGTLAGSPHLITVFSSCPPPQTVKGLCSFIDAYKVLGRLLQNCTDVVDPLKCVLTGRCRSSSPSFYSGKLRKHQVTRLPGEVEALSIAAAVKYFSPFTIQSLHPTTVLTDSKQCVQTIDELCRGDFSASP